MRLLSFFDMFDQLESRFKVKHACCLHACAKLEQARQNFAKHGKLVVSAMNPLCDRSLGFPNPQVARGGLGKWGFHFF